jgi:hypothetical protein
MSRRRKLRIIYYKRRVKRLGCLRRVTKPGVLIPLLEDDWLVPEPFWRERCEAIGPIMRQRAIDTPWNDQGYVGSCTTAMSCHGVNMANAEEDEDIVKLAEATLYAWDGIRSDGSLIPRRSDNGMALDTALLLLRKIGIAPADSTGKNGIPQRDWQRRNWPDNWRALAAENIVTEWRDASRGMQYVMGALSNGLPIGHGYNGHARLIIQALFASTGTRPTKFLCKNSHDDVPNWHELSWRQVEIGLPQYGAFIPIVTIARKRLVTATG